MKYNNSLFPPPPNLIPLSYCCSIYSLVFVSALLDVLHAQDVNVLRRLHSMDVYHILFCLLCEIAVQMTITQEFAKIHVINGGGGRYFVKFGSVYSIDLLASLVL